MTRFFERTEIITSKKKKTEQAKDISADVAAEESEDVTAESCPYRGSDPSPFDCGSGRIYV